MSNPEPSKEITSSSQPLDTVDQFDARVRLIGRWLMIIALISMVVAVVVSVIRGDQLSLPVLLIFAVWGGWMVYMVFRSELFNKKP